MADKKYSNLPGIDRDQPDVYETSDLPEVDQPISSTNAESESESVEGLNILPSEAFKQFQGKNLESSKTDFSDSISRSRRTGYDVPRTEYEILGELGGVKETPEQRFQRLQHEVRELSEDINLIKSNLKEETTAQGMSPVVLAKQVEYLKQQISDLNVDVQLGTQGGGVNLSDPQGALHKRLLTELDGFKAGETKPSKQGTSGAPVADGDHVNYQLYYWPEQAKFGNSARVADLEQRLERLEALIGPNSEKILTLTADVSGKSLLSAVSTLSAKTKLLDPTQLDQIDSRLASVQHRLGQLAQKDPTNDQDPAKANKVSELYDLVKKLEPMAESLPHIVDRLTALKELHQQALNFNQSLTQLDAAQTQITTHLQSHSDVLKQVELQLKDNMTLVQTNCASLAGRLQALNK